MSAFRFSSSKSLTSTPLKSKSSIPKSIPRSKSVESVGDSTYSLLSPIYQQSFDEDSAAGQPTGPGLQGHVSSVPPSRHETESLHAQDAVCTAKLNLSAWEQWVVSKAREERIKMHHKALEQQFMEEKKEQDEREHQRRKTVSECKIQEWLQMKRKQEIKERFYKESQKTKELLHEEQKRMEIEKKAQVKYEEWLQKKKQEEMQRKVTEQEEMARRENEERERKRKAEERFKEWLTNIKDRDQQKQSSKCSTGGYDHLNYPTPSFVNPVPWKPIHIPQQIRAPGKKSTPRKQSGQPKYKSTPCISYKPKDTFPFAFKKW
ncbi:coiled-coil domain-containing protein 34 isoform X2 [Brachyhypopomus gauderio]